MISQKQIRSKSLQGHLSLLSQSVCENSDVLFSPFFGGGEVICFAYTENRCRPVSHDILDKSLHDLSVEKKSFSIMQTRRL